MNIKATSLAPVPPRTAHAFANRTPARRGGLEHQLMIWVKRVSHVLRQLGAQRVDVEVAELAPVEKPLHRVAAQIADTLVLARALGSNHYIEVVLWVHEGGEGGGAGATVLVQINRYLVPTPPGVLQPPQRYSSFVEISAKSCPG